MSNKANINSDLPELAMLAVAFDGMGSANTISGSLTAWTCFRVFVVVVGSTVMLLLVVSS